MVLVLILPNENKTVKINMDKAIQINMNHRTVKMTMIDIPIIPSVCRSCLGNWNLSIPAPLFLMAIAAASEVARAG